MVVIAVIAQATQSLQVLLIAALSGAELKGDSSLYEEAYLLVARFYTTHPFTY